MNARTRQGALLLSALLTACGGSPSSSTTPTPTPGIVFAPAEPTLLSTGSPTKDEDPSVLRARDGAVFVAWFSDRGGNSDLYMASTRDGVTWTGPARATTNADRDFYPVLYQDTQGLFHLTWFRWDPQFRSQILHNTSTDGLTWDTAREESLTSKVVTDDWVPTFTEAADGSFLIYFVSTVRSGNGTSDLFAFRLPRGAATWEGPVPLAGVNSAGENDHLPAAATVAGVVTLVWDRHDTSQALPYLNSKSDLFYSTSSDGLSFAPAARVTSEVGNIVNLFPTLYASSTGSWSILWLTTRAGAPKVFELPLANVDHYPAGGVESAQLPAGYSHRVTATSTPGVYLAAWVQGAEGAQDIYYRLFKK
jgi:hypothetical protein